MSTEANAGLDVGAAVRETERGGKPLPNAVRTFMEPRFGYDFSGVRVHTGGEAANAARAVQARAYTSGSAIVFGEGEYAPSTAQGRMLLAHELAHVVQQGAAKSASPVVQRWSAGTPVDAQAKAAEVEHLVRPGNNEAQALKTLDALKDMRDLLAVVRKLYTDADSTNTDEGARRAYSLLNGELTIGGPATAGVNRARLKAAFDAAPYSALRNPVGEDPGTNPTLSNARKSQSGIARPGDWGEDPDNNTWVMHKEGIRSYFRTSVPRARRSSAWMANNPGNADYLKTLTPRAVGSFRWGKGGHDFAVYFDEADASVDLRERMSSFTTVENYIRAHLGNNPKEKGNNFDLYIKAIQTEVPELSQGDATSKWTDNDAQWRRVVQGFKVAEGWVPAVIGKTLTAADVTATPSDPKEAAVVDYYRARFGVSGSKP
ncbi:eCIS core domain-containing protein [Hyalangium versicolor]|uniref:eCIS core domain-containing protein n=1 Tax=Hyalangium versicolor TaxID=2861190 RepID=UPI001CD001E0|nr:DUF4157 domain-containing protein [Hyalangium versicolor]